MPALLVLMLALMGAVAVGLARIGQPLRRQHVHLAAVRAQDLEPDAVEDHGFAAMWNTPEFGAGSQTFNRVFGATRNPYDTGRTCGGS